jgi:hypothetical protein
MIYAGLDLGQVRDHSAMVILEREAGDSPYYVRYVERVRLGTPYPEVVEWVRRIGAQPEMNGRSALAVDATGVGAPVVEMLRAARLGCTLTAVTITSGEREHETGAMWHVPKKDLLAGVQVLLERGKLRVARGMAETGALVKELVGVQFSQRGLGGVRIGSEGAGQHDDLVIALALAVWRAGKQMVRYGESSRRYRPG